MTKIKKLGLKRYRLLSDAVGTCGSYDPNEISYMFEESVASDEYQVMVLFLSWVNQDINTRSFGSGNYEQRFQEFLTSND